METLFILEYQAQNDGSASALPPLAYQVKDAESKAECISAFFRKCAAAAISDCDTQSVMIVNSEGELWQGYKHTLRHGDETANAE